MAISLKDISRNALKPPRIIIYGPEGIGKTTLCKNTESPVFIQTEDGLVDENIPAFPIAKTLSDVLDALESLGTEQHDYKTVVIESLDWLEPLIWKSTCDRIKVGSIEAPGYGKGYVEADKEWRLFVDYVNGIRDAGMMVIMTAHAAITRVEDPIHPPYDTYTFKLHKRAVGIIKEFADVIGFCNLKTYIQTEDVGFSEKRNRAVSTGERVAHFVASPAYTAKTRYTMPDVLPMDWQEIRKYLP